MQTCYYKYFGFIFLATITFFLPLIVCSQEIVTLNKDKPYTRIGKSVFYLTDSERKLSFDEIRTSAMSSKFIKSEQEANNLGNKDMAVWNYFTIYNPTNENWLLQVESYNVDTLEFYYPDSATGQYKKVISGRYLPFSKRKYKSTYHVFDLPAAINDTSTFYLKVDTYYMQYPLSIITRSEFVAEAHRRDLFTGIYYGLVIVFMIYNFFVFLSVRDKDYLYYVVYIFFNAILIAQLKGFTAELYGDRFHFLWNYAPGIIAITSIVSFIFTRRILETRTRDRKSVV